MALWFCGFVILRFRGFVFLRLWGLGLWGLGLWGLGSISVNVKKDQGRARPLRPNAQSWKNKNDRGVNGKKNQGQHLNQRSGLCQTLVTGGGVAGRPP